MIVLMFAGLIGLLAVIHQGQTSPRTPAVVVLCVLAFWVGVTGWLA